MNSRLYKTYIWAISFTLFVLVSAVIAGFRKEDLGYYFEERRFVTFLSALLLGWTALISGITASFLRLKDKFYPFWSFWRVSCLGFFYLCLDEFFMIHEGMDRAILESMGFDRHAYNFDGWILGFFGCIGIGLVYQSWAEVKTYQNFVKLFSSAVVCFVAMVFADQLLAQNHANMVLEDGYKMAGVTLFLGAYLAALDQTHQNSVS